MVPDGAWAEELADSLFFMLHWIDSLFRFVSQKLFFAMLVLLAPPHTSDQKAVHHVLLRA